MDGNTEAELLLLAPGMLVSEAAPGLKPWLNREDQIFQPPRGALRASSAWPDVDEQGDLQAPHKPGAPAASGQV